MFLRRMEEADIDIVFSSIVREMTPLEKAMSRTCEDLWKSSAQWRVENRRAFVCVIGEEIAGYIFVVEEKTFDERSARTPMGVARKHRGKKVSEFMLKSVNSMFFEEHDLKSFYAIIDKDNIPSIIAFLKSGYKIIGYNSLRLDANDKVILRKDNPNWR